MEEDTIKKITNRMGTIILNTEDVAIEEAQEVEDIIANRIKIILGLEGARIKIGSIDRIGEEEEEGEEVIDIIEQMVVVEVNIFKTINQIDITYLKKKRIFKNKMILIGERMKRRLNKQRINKNNKLIKNNKINHQSNRQR